MAKRRKTTSRSDGKPAMLEKSPREIALEVLERFKERERELREAGKLTRIYKDKSIMETTGKHGTIEYRKTATPRTCQD